MAQHAKLDQRSPNRTASGMRIRAPRPVLEHPHDGLARRAEEIDPQAPEAVELADLLVAMMRRSKGCVGLAATQIGEPARVFCLDVTGHKKARSCAGLVVLANPVITARSGNIVMREGCLSVPHLTGDVARAAEVTVRGFEPGTGRERTIEADGIEARCILHEIDHLDGYLFVDRVFDPVLELFVRKRYL